VLAVLTIATSPVASRIAVSLSRFATNTSGDYFAVSVTRGSDYLTGVVLQAPRAFPLTLMPGAATARS
jgi:hypothetical protein